MKGVIMVEQRLIPFVPETEEKDKLRNKVEA